MALPVQNINTASLKRYNDTAQKINGKSYCIIQLNQLASAEDKKNLESAGIKLLEYIPANAYLAEISRPMEEQSLKQANARSIINIDQDLKIETALKNNLTFINPIKVWVILFNTVEVNTAIAALQDLGYKITSLQNKQYRVLEISASGKAIIALAALPFIKYIENAPPEPQSLDLDSRNQSKTNLLQTGIPGDYNLDGEGVVVGVAEVAGSPFPHVDFKDRLIAITPVGRDYHSTHINGIVAGAGLVNELCKGYAPKSTILTTSISSFASPYFQNLGVVITNNSYSTGYSCKGSASSIGQYIYDLDANIYPNLQNVWANGNSGGSTCGVYPFGFKTGLAGQGGSKSVISVGLTLKDETLHPGSSRGPAIDGRIKPDLVAPGGDILSTTAGNGYQWGSGSSMSSPAVAGGLALMYQRYRQLHNNQNPTAALMKAILCNTANDQGNAGPDFSYGFGNMNLYRAIKAIDGKQYFIDAVGNNEIKTINITVPAGGTQLKVLVYWQDPASSVLSSRSLVNDLDLTVTSPSGIVNLPYILDTLPANVANPATKGEDHINNIEQVVIDFPQAGNYAVKIKGTEVNGLITPSQEFCVVYDLLPNNIMLGFPSGNEALIPAENIKIDWDAWGPDDKGYTLEFSPDNGVNWQVINTSIATGKKQYDWQLPNITTAEALIRLTRNNDLISSVSGKFSIIAQPDISFASDQCPGNISLQWNTIAMADHYEVMRIKNGEMAVIDTVTGINYTFRNLSEDSTYWVTARAIINNKAGRRAVALSSKPDHGTCMSPLFDNDLKADALISPVIGRAFTSAGLHTNEAILFRIKNLDNQPVNNYTVSYSVNNGNWVVENVNIPIPANSTFVYHFNTGYNFSQAGDYAVKLVVKNTIADVNAVNDTIQATVHQLANDPIDLTNAFTENFEKAEDDDYNISTFALKGIERFDYNKITSFGKLDIPTNEMSDTSGKSLKLSYVYPTDSTLNDQSIMGTFNFSNYNVASSRILLNFNLTAYLGCYDDCLPDSSKLMIRGNDTLPWIEVIKLNTAQETFYVKKFNAINLIKYLLAAGQDFSSSFQIKWQDTSVSNVYLLDDIVLYNGTNNLGISFVDPLAPYSCNLGSIPLKIRIYNSKPNPATDVQVYYKINNGEPVTEKIALIPGDSTILYSFTNIANLTAYGSYIIEAGIIHPGDSYPENNIVRTSLHNQPLINKLPYLENFEKNDGGWYAEGTNSSWAYGKPASVLINKAASGSTAWKTNLNGNYNKNELSYLYSPCIDYSGIPNPMFSFSLALNTNNCQYNYCDALVLQYSTDGTNWNSLPFTDTSYNYSYTYNWPGYLSSRNYYRWHVVTMALPVATGPVRFRFLFRSNDLAETFEGVGIDDIHIYDSSFSIYDTTMAGTAVVKSITGGNDWTSFTKDNKIIASVNSYGQNLGNTTLKSYIRKSIPVLNFHGQYYLNRNFTLRTDKQSLSDSIGIRLYFLDNETDSLLFAKNCIACDKPADAYRLGISKYSTTVATEENDSISDNIKGEWSFIENQKIKIVPYLNGYYAEFKIKDLSEFWLSSGGPDKKSWLTVQLVNITANKSQGGVNLTWTSASEINISKFEIQVAKGNAAYAGNNFSTIGTVASDGASTQNQLYTYADASPGNEGVIYYRLKTTDEFGNYSYSKAVPLLFTSDLNWHIYPNPSDGLYKIECQVSDGEKIRLAVYNILGQLVKTQEITGNGFIQQAEIDLKRNANGIYMVQVSTDTKQYYFKVVKQ